MIDPISAVTGGSANIGSIVSMASKARQSEQVDELDSDDPGVVLQNFQKILDLSLVKGGVSLSGISPNVEIRPDGGVSKPASNIAELADPAKQLSRNLREISEVRAHFSEKAQDVANTAATMGIELKHLPLYLSDPTNPKVNRLAAMIEMLKIDTHLSQWSALTSSGKSFIRTITQTSG
jgi:hypothetical protein